MHKHAKDYHPGMTIQFVLWTGHPPESREDFIARKSNVGAPYSPLSLLPFLLLPFLIIITYSCLQSSRSGQDDHGAIKSGSHKVRI